MGLISMGIKRMIDGAEGHFDVVTRMASEWTSEWSLFSQVINILRYDRKDQVIDHQDR